VILSVTILFTVVFIWLIEIFTSKWNYDVFIISIALLNFSSMLLAFLFRSWIAYIYILKWKSFESWVW
jgi:ABC-type uncharacterized transport system permease subunit